MGEKTDLKDSCAYCKITNCLDLFRHTKEYGQQLIGGELYIYKQLKHSNIDEQKYRQYICLNGVLFQCLCFVINTSNVLFPEDPLAVICNEVVGDMKASLYLALSGHYRQAIIIQRCIFENFLYGLYFGTKYYKFSNDKSIQEDVVKEFNSWCKGNKSPKSTRELLDIIYIGRTISKDEKREWDRLYGDLSKFVHTILHTSTGEKIKEEIKGGKKERKTELNTCHAVVEFNEIKLKEWASYFQRLSFIILYKVIFLYPPIKNVNEGKTALWLIRTHFKNIKKRSITKI